MMLGYPIRRFIENHQTLTQLAVAGIIGLALGTANILFSPRMVLIAAIGIFGMLVALKRPEMVFLSMIVVFSTIVDVNIVPLIPIGVGSLNLFDAALLLFAGLIIMRSMVEPDFKLIYSPLTLPLIGFYFFAAFSTLIAILQSTLATTPAFREMRYITYYLMVLVIVNLIREERQVKLLIRGFFILATFVAVAMIIQYAIGSSFVFIYGRVETLTRDGQSVAGVARLIPSGRYLILVAFITMTMWLVLEPSRMLKVFPVLQWVALAVAVILTFNRNFWISSLLVFFIFGALTDRQVRKNLLKWSLVMLVLLSIIPVLAFFAPDSEGALLLKSTFDRMISVFSTDTYEDAHDSNLAASSLAFRAIEDEYASPYLTPPSLIGIGMGAQYRPFDPALDWEQFDGRGYIHNAHLWVIIKAGLLSYIFLIIAFFISVKRGLKYYRYLHEPRMKAIVLGFSLSLIGIMTSAIVDPILTDLAWTPVFGVMIGITEVIYRDLSVKETLEPSLVRVEA
jgi:MFS family permease